MSDDVSNFPTEPRTICQTEEEIFQRADIVFATAQSLVKKAERVAQRVHYLPNGVDFDFFNNNDNQIPADLAKIPEPRIIFVGIIDDWFDFEGIVSAACAFADYNFVIIGPAHGGARTQRWIKKFDSQENIHVMGSRPFAQVPGYLAHSQVGIIPFIKNQLTDSINPIKLFEYAAAGLPIVCRDLEEVRHLKSPALLYNDLDTLIASLKEAIHNHELLSPASITFGQANTWGQRYQTIKKELATFSTEI